MLFGISRFTRNQNIYTNTPYFYEHRIQKRSTQNNKRERISIWCFLLLCRLSSFLGPPSGLWSILDFIFAALGFLLFFRAAFSPASTTLSPSPSAIVLNRVFIFEFFSHSRLILSVCKQLVCFHFASLLLQFYWPDFKSIGAFIFAPAFAFASFNLLFDSPVCLVKEKYSF